MARTNYDPDSIEEDLAVMEERDALEAGVPIVSLDTPIAELPLQPAHVLGIGASVGDAIRAMQREKVSAVVIVDAGQLAGIFTERDVVTRVALSIRDPDRTSIAEVMTPDPESLRLDDAIVFVISRMLIGGFRHVPVVDGRQRPLHVIAMRDLMAHLLDRAERRISTLPPSPFHGESRLDLGYG